MEFLQQTSKAYEFAQKYLHTRTGFGALSHFHKIGFESMLLAVNSSFYKGSKPHFLMIKYDLRSFIKDDLTKPNSYDPPTLWALFWALAKAEHNFLSRYIPHWSNEERLTGHFVSQIIERIIYKANRF